MSGKKGNIRIDICLPSNIVVPEAVKKPINEEVPFPRKWLRDVWEFARQDTNRVTFALKVGLACFLVSLLILFRAPYDIFETHIIESILTVVIMFEYTVGATFNRGFNRALGSVLAGVSAIVIIQVAMSSGHIAEPYIIGFSIFLIGAVTSFMKLWPSLVPYEYSFRVILLTYCLIIVSGYRMGNPIRIVMNRLYSIAIGGLVAVLVNAFIFPIWAGEQLHKDLVNNFNSLADSLEECVKKYISDNDSKHLDFSKTIMDDLPDEPAFGKCLATLNSSEKLVSLAPHILKCAFRSEILDATNQVSELLRSLARDVNNMKWSLQTSLLKQVHVSTERLQYSIGLHSYMFTANHEDNSAKAQLKTTRFVSFNLKDFNKESDKPEGMATGNTTTPSAPMEAESYHKMIRRQQRGLHSWPPREIDNFKDDENVVSDLMPRMCALESTTTLSLVTFTSLLIEFVARLDHLVQAVEKLATMAQFKADHELTTQ